MGQIPAKFLKNAADAWAYPPSEIIDLSVKLSVFPEECNFAKLKSPFKKRFKTDPRKYRPISSLPLVTKIIKKCIHYRWQDYLKENGLLYKYHSGFRANFSIDSCLAQLTDFILRGTDKGMYTDMILIDFQKEFDTPVIKWFESFLRNWNIILWCPSGIYFGTSLVFTIYQRSSSGSGSYLYVDDTSSFYQKKDVRKIEDFLNKEFLTLWEWFVHNRLSIGFGEDKTDCILFSKTKRSSKLIMPYGDHSKQYHTVEYLRCHYNLIGGSMAMKFLKRQCKS